MRVTLINTTWWQGREYRDVNMPCTQEWAIIVACHHIMNMHNNFWEIKQLLPILSCLPAFYTLAIPVSCYISNVFSLPEMNTVYGTSIILPYNLTSFLIKHYFEISLVLSNTLYRGSIKVCETFVIHGNKKHALPVHF